MSFDPFRLYTQARIGLGSHAPALPTKAWLEFAYHHACAIDAVHMPWRIDECALVLAERGFQSLVLKTAVSRRDEYLMRPDLGRVLDPQSERILSSHASENHNVVVLISNGLSSSAVDNHLMPFLNELLVAQKKENIAVWSPFLLADNSRVGLIDHVGAILKPSVGIVIIGERPGLSAPDSLAVYLTYQPQAGLTDASRNCISNIRPPHGLSYSDAAAKTRFLVVESLKRKLSGVSLKEEADNAGYKSTCLTNCE